MSMGEGNGEVVGLHGATPWQGEPRQTIIDTCEELLRMAKAGEMQGLAAAFLHRDHTASFRIAGLAGSYTLLGAIGVVERRLINHIERTD